MNRRAIAKKIADAKTCLVVNVEFLGKEFDVDPALIAAVGKARGRGDSLAANQIEAVSNLVEAVVIALGGIPAAELPVAESDELPAGDEPTQEPPQGDTVPAGDEPPTGDEPPAGDEVEPPAGDIVPESEEPPAVIEPAVDLEPAEDDPATSVTDTKKPNKKK